MAQLTAEKFPKIDSAKAFRALLAKDLETGAQPPGDPDGSGVVRHDYVLADAYPFAKGASPVFLLASPTDNKWKAVIEEIEEKGKSFTKGECQLVEQDGGVTIVLRSCTGKLKAKPAAKLLTALGKKDGFAGSDLGAYLSTQSHDTAVAEGKIEKLDKSVLVQLVKVDMEFRQYQKFAGDFETFCTSNGLTGYDKIPVNIWASLMQGILKKGKAFDEIAKEARSKGERVKLAYQGPSGERVRNAVLQEAMDGLNKFVAHAETYMDKVIKTKAASSTWAFWSGTGAKEAALAQNPSGIVLEGTVGSWFDSVWDFGDITGLGNFQLWTALSELYAKKAAENYDAFDFKGYVGPGATTEQNVFNQIESPTFIEVLGQRHQVDAPEIEWNVVRCAEDSSVRGGWRFEAGDPVESTHPDRTRALARVTQLYGG